MGAEQVPASRLRILHVSEVHWGGVVTLLDHFTAQQRDAGHEVHVLAPPGMPAFPGVGQRRWRLDRSRPWTAGPAVADLRRAVHEVQPDVVHLHSFVAGFLGRLPGAEAWLRARVPTVYQPHAWSFDLFPRASVGATLRRWEAWAATKTDLIVANCDDEIEEGRASGVRAPAHTLGVAVDVERFHPVQEHEQEQYRSELGLSAKHVLVCVGRLTRQKGQDLLLAAWERARPPDTQLVLVGPGDPEPLRASSPEQWDRSVVAVGEQADVRPWLWASDALVLPSRYETVALVVAESMGCGRPVVATAVNGAEATIVAGPLPSAGAVVPLGDMQQLVERCAHRLGDPELWRAEAAAARQRAEQLFRPEVVAARLEAAYREAIARHRQRVAA